MDPRHQRPAPSVRLEAAHRFDLVGRVPGLGDREEHPGVPLPLEAHRPAPGDVEDEDVTGSRRLGDIGPAADAHLARQRHHEQVAEVGRVGHVPASRTPHPEAPHGDHVDRPAHTGIAMGKTDPPAGEDAGAIGQEARLHRSGVGALGGRVLARELRAQALEAGLGPLVPRLAFPGAPQIIADVHPQAAERTDLQLEHVAVDQRVQTTMVRAGRDDVAGLERMHRGDERNALGDRVRHVGRVEVLHQGPVVPQTDGQVLRIVDLVGRHDVRADRAERPARLHLVERVLARRDPACRSVHQVRVAEHVVERCVGRDIVGVAPDDDRQLRFRLEHRGRDVREDHRVTVADHAVRRLREGVDRRALGQRPVLHVVARHAVDVRRPRQRRAHPHPVERHARPARSRRFEEAAIRAPVGDDPVDDVLRMGAGDPGGHLGHVDHAVARRALRAGNRRRTESSRGDPLLLRRSRWHVGNSREPADGDGDETARNEPMVRLTDFSSEIMPQGTRGVNPPSRRCGATTQVSTERRGAA